MTIERILSQQFWISTAHIYCAKHFRKCKSVLVHFRIFEFFSSSLFNSLYIFTQLPILPFTLSSKGACLCFSLRLILSSLPQPFYVSWNLVSRQDCIGVKTTQVWGLDGFSDLKTRAFNYRSLISGILSHLSSLWTLICKMDIISVPISQNCYEDYGRPHVIICTVPSRQ